MMKPFVIVALTVFLWLPCVPHPVVAPADAELEDEDSSCSTPPWTYLGAPMVIKVPDKQTYRGKLQLSPDGHTMAIGYNLEHDRMGVTGYGVSTYTYVHKAKKWIALDTPMELSKDHPGEAAGCDMAMSENVLAISKVGFHQESKEDQVHVHLLSPSLRNGVAWVESFQPIVNDSPNKDKEAFGQSVALAEMSQANQEVNAFFVAVGIPGIYTEDESPTLGRVQVYKPAFHDDNPFAFDSNDWEKVGPSILGNTWDFGSTVQLSKDGKVVAVQGATACSSNNCSDPRIPTCVVQVFEFSEDTSGWIQRGQDIMTDDSKHNFVCKSWDLSGDGASLVAGSRFLSAPNKDPVGHVHVWFYDESHSKKWMLKGTNIDTLVSQYVSNKKNRVHFGSKLSLSRDGTRLAVTVTERPHNQRFDLPKPIHRHSSVLTFDWKNSTQQWTQILGSLDLPFGVDSTALSADGTVLATALKDQYQQNVAQVFSFDSTPSENFVGEEPVFVTRHQM